MHPTPARGQLRSLFSPRSGFSQRSLGAPRMVGGHPGTEGCRGGRRVHSRDRTGKPGSGQIRSFTRCECSATEPRALGPLFRVFSRSPPRRGRLQDGEEGGIPETRFPAPSLPQHGTGWSCLVWSVESACPGVHRPSGFFQAQAPEDRCTLSPVLSLCPKGPAGGRRAQLCPSVLF